MILRVWQVLSLVMLFCNESNLDWEFETMDRLQNVLSPARHQDDMYRRLEESIGIWSCYDYITITHLQSNLHWRSSHTPVSTPGLPFQSLLPPDTQHCSVSPTSFPRETSTA
jgi:hypothetical protein